MVNSIVRIQACTRKNGNKGIYIVSSSIPFTCADYNLMFNSGEFCDSASDQYREKKSDRNQSL